MKVGFCVGVYLFIGLVCSEVWAQQPDSAQTQRPDSVALRAFLTAEGPAELVVSFSSPTLYQFNSGAYAVSNPAFPLLYSPDSLVRWSIQRAHRQRRAVRISTIATTVSLVALSLSATSYLVRAIGAGKSLPSDSFDVNLVRATGLATLAGITVTASFSIASFINGRRGIRRHNGFLGRRMPTSFHPKGL